METVSIINLSDGSPYIYFLTDKELNYEIIFLPRPPACEVKLSENNFLGHPA